MGKRTRARRSGRGHSRPLPLYTALLIAIAAVAIAVGLLSSSSAREHTSDARSRTHRQQAVRTEESTDAAKRAGAEAQTQTQTAHESNERKARQTQRQAGRTASSRRRRRSEGSLPQTSALPSSKTRAFRAEMSALWSAIVLDRPSLARSAFFPEGAYLQLKAIEDPAGDYSSRLLHDYYMDIEAAHRLLGAGASSAQLIRIEVPGGYAHWVPPEVCYNRDGYYETPNSRIIYRENGKLRSFGIASMISWRGVWYVVHLGAILRSVDAGVVDAPSAGEGYAEPSSTC